jgi:hypothetical protein
MLFKLLVDYYATIIFIFVDTLSSLMQTLAVFQLYRGVAYLCLLDGKYMKILKG